MNELTKDLVRGLMEIDDTKVVALYGGGFKPPVRGHFNVVKQALAENPNIDEFRIFVGSGERDNIEQAESLLIWDIYKNYLPQKVKIIPSKAPIGDIYKSSKNEPELEFYWVLGCREGDEDDEYDIQTRTTNLKSNPDKYNNLKVKVITTSDSCMRATNARKALKSDPNEFKNFLPHELSDEDKEEVYNIASTKLINENATYSDYIDYKGKIKDLTKHMVKQGMNILPLPKVVFHHSEKSNAKNFFGKTAYYNPKTKTIVLYTEGRHPKDIVRSFSHEMIHHIQNLENRLGDITTTNTNEDDDLDSIEREAYQEGNMIFRNWTDSIDGKITTDIKEGGSLIPIKIKKEKKDPFGLNAYALELSRGLEEDLEKDNVKEYTIYSDMDGVIADFDTRFKQFSDGIEPSNYVDKFGLEKFWELIDEKVGARFWTGIKWMSDGKEYWDYIEKYKPILLSAPSRNNESRLGKRVWAKRNLPGVKLILAFANNKKNYANESSILIDDREKNINQWREAGGIGILHTSTASTIAQLKELGL